MAPIPPTPNNLMPNLTPFRVGHPFQAIACAAPLTLDVLQGSLGGGLLNASRTPIDQFRTYGAKSDEPVVLVGQRNIPQTGYPALDRAINKFADSTDYIPQATEDAITNSLKWGLGASAGTCAATGLLLMLLHKGKILQPASRQLMGIIPIAFGAIVGTMTAIGAFSYSFFQNFRDFHRHMAKTTLDPKAKPR